MKVRLIWTVFCVIALAGCNLRERLWERELGWVRSADAETMLRDDVRHNRIRFLAVCWRGCFTPDLGPLTYERCYRRHAETRTIDNTGDVIVSGEQLELKAKAAALASAYNRRALAFLDSTGRRDCPPAQQWDKLANAMGALADSVPKHPYKTSISGGVPQNGIDFELHVPDPVDLTASLKGRLCALVPQFGVDSIHFRVTTGDINNHPHEDRPFACYGGRVAA